MTWVLEIGESGPTGVLPTATAMVVKLVGDKNEVENI